MSRKHGYDPKNRKIDLFFNGDYLCSTNWSKTCRQAREYYLNNIERGPISLVDSRIKKHPHLLKARFAK